MLGYGGPPVSRARRSTQSCAADPGDRSGLWRSRISGAPLRRCTASGTHATAGPNSTELECLAYPGALVLVGLQPARLHEGVGVLVPAAVGEIVPQHRRGGLRLIDNT